MRTPAPTTILRRSAVALATTALLGACWSDIKEQGNNEAGGDVPLPTQYDSAVVPSEIPQVAPTTPPAPGMPAGTDSVRRDSVVPPAGG